METAAALAGIQPDDEFYTPPPTHKHYKIHTKRKKDSNMSKHVKTSVHKHTQPLRALTCSPKHDVHELENILFS